MLLARAEYNYYPEEIIEEKVPNKEYQLKRQAIKSQRQKRKNKSKLLTLGFVVFIMAFGLFVLFGYANISRVSLEINELEYQRNQLESEKLALIADLEGIKATRKIAEEAMYKLGMTYPKESQVVYISVNELNEVTDNAVAKGSIFNIFNKVLGLFSSLF